MAAPTARLLEEPLPPLLPTSSFFEGLYPHDDLLTPYLLQLRAALREGIATADWLEEQFCAMATSLAQAHLRACREAEQIPALRPSTRCELYRRLHLARDFMDSCLDQPLRAAQIAEVACLSTPHFFRVFKQAFHQTPHQYLVQKRLERARKLLAETDLPISLISQEVGFESPGAFSGLFHRRQGVSPERFRRERRG